MWAVIGLEAGVWALVEDEWEIFGYGFGVFCGLLAALGIFYAIGQEDHLSVRVRRDIPRNPLRRAVAFLFFNGALGGLILSCLFSFGGLLIIFSGLEAWPMLTGSSSSTHDWSEFCSGFIMLGLYLIAHALMSLWIHRTWLPTRNPMWPRLFFFGEYRNSVLRHFCDLLSVHPGFSRGRDDPRHHAQFFLCHRRWG